MKHFRVETNYKIQLVVFIEVDPSWEGYNNTCKKQYLRLFGRTSISALQQGIIMGT